MAANNLWKISISIFLVMAFAFTVYSINIDDTKPWHHLSQIASGDSGLESVGETITVDGGKVGIGTTDPLHSLHVAGGGVHADGTTYGVYGSGSTYGVRGDGIGVGSYGVYGSGNLYGVRGIGGTYGVYGSGTSYAGYFAGRGYFSDNVGIGVAPSATDKLDVQGNMRVADVYIDTPHAGGSGWISQLIQNAAVAPTTPVAGSVTGVCSRTCTNIDSEHGGSVCTSYDTLVRYPATFVGGLCGCASGYTQIPLYKYLFDGAYSCIKD